MLLLSSLAQALYYLGDDSWPYDIAATSATAFSAVAVDHTAPGGKEIHVIQRGPQMSSPVLVFDETGRILRTWGNATCSFANNTWGSHGLNIQFPRDGTTPLLWVFDFFAGKVLLHSRAGKLVASAGTAQRGTGTAPVLQYGNVADGDFGPDGMAYVSDGDGGVNNRVVALDTTLGDLDSPEALRWISGNGEGSPKAAGDPGYSSPHSVALHARTGSVLVADRGHGRLVILDSKTGKQRGEWSCWASSTPKPGADGGLPYGVRTVSSHGDDLVLVAAANVPSDGANQWLHVLDGAALTPDGAPGKCRVLERVSIRPTNCVTPHELGVDATNGDVYLACVTANQTIGSTQGLLRFRRARDTVVEA